jgi:hypothetical protein
MKTAWVIFRIVRWGLWLATIAYFFHFFLNRADHLTPFGHLLTRTELWMFGLPTVAVFAGFLELMMRERAGLPRPAIGRNWTA